MANITYIITSGFPNFIVHLEPQLVDDQIQTSTGTFNMTDVPDGTYTLTITDVYHCVFTISNIVINSSFSTTTTTSTTLPITTTTTTTACSRPNNLTFKWFVYFIYTTQVPAGYNITTTLVDAVNSISVLASDLTSALLEGVDAINYNVGSVMYVHNNTTDCQKITDGYYPSWNGQKCSYDIYHVVSGVIVSITHNTSCVGLLYNTYTTNSLEIISGWKVPTLSDWQTLITTLGTDYSVTHNNALKETGLIHWNNPNLGATNTTNFYAFGGGYRDNLGVFSGIKDYGYWYAFYSGTANYISMSASDYLISNSTADSKFGFSIRLLKNNSTDPGTVTDYDGNVYNTVTIGNQVWMAENLKTQHFSNGTVIQYLSSASDWSSTTLPALCPYNNDWINNSCTVQIIPLATTTTTTTTANINYQCHVLYNDASGYLWEYLTPDGSNTTISVIFSGLDLNSFNIAMTANKLWAYNLTPGGTNSIFEYNISFNPWSISFNRTITYTIPATGSAPKGLCAINNTTLVVGGVYSSTSAYGDIYSIYQLDTTTTTASATKLFDLYAGFNVTGDILYLSSRNTFVIAYNNSTSDLRIGEFSTNGLVLHEVLNIPNYPTGLYLYNNNVYTIDSTGFVYLFDIVNYIYIYKNTITNNLGILGADSICFSNLIFATTTTTTTCSITTTTTTTLFIITIGCSTATSYSGGYSYPNSYSITLGTGLGEVDLIYNMQAVPDMMLIYFDNLLVINTGYRGDASYDFGGSNRLTFKNSLNAKFDPLGPPRIISDPILGTVYLTAIFPNFTLYPDDGYPRILGVGSGSSKFYKNTTTTTASALIYSPLPGTAWGFQLTCPNPYEIGAFFGGGYIAYILQPGDTGYNPLYVKGLIVAPEDQSTGCTWWNGSYIQCYCGNNGTDGYGYGVTNTSNIINYQGNTGSYAAKLCADYRGGGYSDWFLPNLAEMNYVWTNCTINGGSIPITNYASYWLSNEWSSDYTQAWAQYFGFATETPTYSLDLNGLGTKYVTHYGPRYKLPKSVSSVGSNTPYNFWSIMWPTSCTHSSCIPAGSKWVYPTCYARACRYFTVLK